MPQDNHQDHADQPFSPDKRPSDENQPIYEAQPLLDEGPSNNPSPVVKWTKPAWNELISKIESGDYAQNAKASFEGIVLRYLKREVPQATQARIRKPPHEGGTDPDEPPHMTVSFKVRNRPIDTRHIYTHEQ